MTKKLLLVSLLLLLLPLVSCNTPPMELSQYCNEDFCIKYPTEWEPLSKEAAQMIRDIEKELRKSPTLAPYTTPFHANPKRDSSSTLFLPFMAVVKVVEHSHKTLNEAIEANIPLLGIIYSGYEHLDTIKGPDIQGRNSAIIIFRDSSPPTPSISYRLVVMDGKIIWNVELSAPEEDIDTYKPTFDRIFESFQLKGEVH